MTKNKVAPFYLGRDVEYAEDNQSNHCQQPV